jgi:succinate dehydrogenase/fumarate reductase cytochrome b subunit
MKLRIIHKYSALGIVAFSAVHITNHLVSLINIQSHIAFMDIARNIYRQPVIEGLLLLCVVFQATSGLWLLIRGWKQRHGFVAWLQAISGSYLACFLLVHVGVVLYGRAILQLDTNFYFAAAGFHVPPNQFFFVPYYFLAVLALLTHLACAAYWSLLGMSAKLRALALVLPMLVGALVSLLIVLSLAGQLQPVDVPSKYKATYTGKVSMDFNLK